jgi:hypothetical protein
MVPIIPNLYLAAEQENVVYRELVFEHDFNREPCMAVRSNEFGTTHIALHSGGRLLNQPES